MRFISFVLILVFQVIIAKGEIIRRPNSLKTQAIIDNIHAQLDEALAKMYESIGKINSELKQYWELNKLIIVRETDFSDYNERRIEERTALIEIDMNELRAIANALNVNISVCENEFVARYEEERLAYADDILRLKADMVLYFGVNYTHIITEASEMRLKTRALQNEIEECDDEPVCLRRVLRNLLAHYELVYALRGEANQVMLTYAHKGNIFVADYENVGTGFMNNLGQSDVENSALEMFRECVNDEIAITSKN